MAIWERILNAFGAKRSLENPSVPLSAGADWLYDGMGASRASSGMRVSRETAMTHDAWWRGVNLISRDVAKIPIMVQRRKGMAWEPDPDHPASFILRRQPNTEMTPFIFRQVLMYHVLSMGNAYAYIDRDPYNGDPIEMIPLMPHETYPERKNGKLYYVTQIGAEQRTLFPENVFHLKGLGYDGLAGYNTVTKARESLGLAIAQTKYAAVFFRNNAQPSIVLKHPAVLSDVALKRLKDSWTAMQGGIDNAHKPKIVEEGMEVEQISINARDAQLLESRQFEIRACANWLNVPPHKLGDNSRLAYNSLEQENQAYLDDTLEPWFINWEEECEAKLLTEKQKRKDSHRIQFNRRRLIHANLQARAEYWTAMVNNGLACPDMAADEEGWNPLPDGIGQRYRMPLNISILDEDGMPIQPEKEPDEDDPVPGKDQPAKDPVSADVKDVPSERNSFEPEMRELLKHCCQRHVRWIGREARNAAKTPKKFNDFLDGMATKYVETIKKDTNPSVSVARKACGRNAEWAAGVAETIVERAKNALLEVSGNLKPAEFEAGIGAFLDDFEQKEPENVVNGLFS